jgi:hypothetical protein
MGLRKTREGYVTECICYSLYFGICILTQNYLVIQIRRRIGSVLVLGF